MRKLIRNFASLSLFTALGLSSISTLAVDPPGWVGPVDIKSITVQPQGNIYIEIDGVVPDLGCPAQTAGWLQLEPSYTHFEQQFSLLSSAYLARQKILIYVSECDYFPLVQNTRLTR